MLEWITAHPVATTLIVMGIVALIVVAARAGAIGGLLSAVGDIID